MQQKYKLGESVKETSVIGRRDAFHVAAVLCTSEDRLYAGDSVHFVNLSLGTVERSPMSSMRHGIVDPFHSPAKGELFWVLIDPQHVGDITHHFTLRLPMDVMKKEEPKKEPVKEIKVESTPDKDNEEEDPLFKKQHTDKEWEDKIKAAEMFGDDAYDLRRCYQEGC